MNAHVRDEGVVGSNPIAPTTVSQGDRQDLPQALPQGEPFRRFDYRWETWHVDGHGHCEVCEAATSVEVPDQGWSIYDRKLGRLIAYAVDRDQAERIIAALEARP